MAHFVLNTISKPSKEGSLELLSQSVGMPSNAARRTGARISMRGQVSKCVAHRDEPVQFPT